MAIICICLPFKVLDNWLVSPISRSPSEDMGGGEPETSVLYFSLVSMVEVVYPTDCTERKKSQVDESTLDCW